MRSVLISNTLLCIIPLTARHVIKSALTKLWRLDERAVGWHGSPVNSQSKLNFGLSILMMCCAVSCDSPQVAQPESPDMQTKPIQVVSDLPSYAKQGDRTVTQPLEYAFLGRRGAIWSPGLPGWARVAQVGEAGPWQPRQLIDGRMGSWLRGMGGHLVFPVGDEGPAMRDLSVWLYPSARKQAVSVFLDGKPLTTIRLKSGWHRYDFKLPKQGLKAGEHRLRFWFRTLRYRGHLRTPGALGAVSIRPNRVQPEVSSQQQDGSLLWDEVRYRLPAGAPSRWTTDTIPMRSTRLVARAVVDRGASEFVVRVSEDGEGTIEASRLKVAAGSPVDVNVSLAPWAGRLVRVTLLTEGEDSDLDNARWERPRWVSSEPKLTTAPSIRNVVVWTIEGLWSTGPSLGRTGDFAATPNMDLLARSGAVVMDTWSGGHTAMGGQRRLLGADSSASWPALLHDQGVTTGLFTVGRVLADKITDRFDTHQHLDGEADSTTGSALFEALNHWLEVRKYQPFLAYVDAGRPIVASRRTESPYQSFRSPPPIGKRVKIEGEVLQDYRAYLSFQDYWVGALMALLKKHDRLRDTAVFIVGIPSRRVNPFAKNALSPNRLHVPVIAWIPGIRPVRRHLRLGADLSDLGPTLMELLGKSVDDALAGRPLLANLLTGRAGVTQSAWAKTAFGRVLRYGDWIWWPASQASTRLWAHHKSGPRFLETKHWPIVVRALKDRLSGRR